MTVTLTATRPRVLVTNPGNGWPRALAEALEREGYEVIFAGDAESASRQLAESRFGAVIGDWSAGGPELLSRLRCEGRGGGDGGYTYVIMTSAAADDMNDGIAAGADDFLIQPVDPGVLLSRMRVAARIRRMREDIHVKNSELSEANHRLEAANQKMRRELGAAARVQQALLPPAEFCAPGARIGWNLRASHVLAGDILNCLRLDEHHLAFFVLDVCGHGVSSALLSVQVSRLMSPLMTESELLKARLSEPPWYRVVEPVEVLRRLNEMFQMHGEVVQYFTMIYGLLHGRSGRMRMAAAGHPGPWLVPPEGEPRELTCRSHPVGLIESADFYTHEVQLEPGDRVWFYSDGVTEAADANDDEWGRDRLRESITAQGDVEVQPAVDRVMRAVERWCAPGEPDDDCTLLCIEREPADS